MVENTPRRSKWAWLVRLWPFIAVLSPLVLAIPAIQPLLHDQLTVGYDNVLHLWRSLEAEQMLAQGSLYSRWYPHMVFGLGYPMLLFNPPLSPLLAAILHRLGLGWPAAVNGVFALGTLFSGVGVWLLVRDEYGNSPGLVAAAAMVTIPFHVYVNFHRASMSEALAWTFPGIILWGLRSWLSDKKQWGLMASAGGLAAMLLTHDAFAYLFIPLPCLLVLALAFAHRDWNVLWRGVLAMALGVGLSAFFWLPSILERSYVQFDRVLEYNYAASFVPLDYLLESPRSADTALINPWLPKGMGLLPVLAALLSLGAIWQACDRVQRFWLGTIFLFTFGYIWLASPYAAWFWRLLPPLAYLHFPWRFFSPAAVGVAVLAGAGIGWLSRRYKFTAPVAIAVLILGALGWLYPQHMELSYPTTLPGMLEYEYVTQWLGGTTFAELLPRQVKSLPESNPLDADLRAGREPVRLRPESLPDGAAILEADYRPNHARLVVDSPVDFHALYWCFYYPGWRVRIDGQEVPITPTDPEGLIAFDIPSGRHTLNVDFGETPLRLVADAVSIISLVGLGIALFLSKVSPSQDASGAAPDALKPGIWQWVAVGMAFCLPVLKIAFLDQVDTPLRYHNLSEGSLTKVDVAQAVTFDGQFHLLGYDALPGSSPADQSLVMRLYWQDSSPGGPDYKVGLALEDAQGIRWSDASQYPPRWYREPPATSEWPADKYALTATELRPLTGTPPGIYTVTLSVFNAATSAAYAFNDVANSTWGTELVLGTVQLTRPDSTAQELDARYLTDEQWGPLRLAGYSLDREEASPGDPLLVTCFWEAVASPQQDCDVQLQLVSVSTEEPVAAFEYSPIHEDFPTTQWQPGDLWRSQYMLRLPASLESDTYSLNLTACSESALDFTLGEIQVNAPERLWQVPAVDFEVDTSLGDFARLAGANISSLTPKPGETLDVTLVWQAVGQTTGSYRVFLHLLGPDGGVVAQSDSFPASWSRPTTGWVENEVVLDTHTLSIPEDAVPGVYPLQAGMYMLEEGRLQTSEGGDAVQITTLKLIIE